MIHVAFLLAAAVPCPAERAGYVLRDDRSVTARLHPVRATDAWPAGVALAVRLGRTERTYWLLPVNGGTNARTAAVLVGGPDRQGGTHVPAGPGTAFLSADAGYRFRPSVPRHGETAPAHLLFPHFGREVWYLADHAQKRDDFPVGFFDLISCAPAGEPLVDVELPSVP